MEDNELYAQILGIRSPWRVDRVELKLAEREVHIHLAHEAAWQWTCPECGRPCPLYDHQPERRWRHLDTCQYQTILHAEPPRSNCIDHGARAVKPPWAEPSSRFTALFERLAIDWLKAASQKAVAEQLGLSWDEIHAIQERAVQRGLMRRQAEPVEHLGIDEKSFYQRAPLLHSGQRSGSKPGAVCCREPDRRKPEWLLGNPLRPTTIRSSRGGNGYVGSLRQLHP